MKKLRILRSAATCPYVALVNLEVIINRRLEPGDELLSPPNLVPYADPTATFPARFVAYATVQYEVNNDSNININIV